MFRRHAVAGVLCLSLLLTASAGAWADPSLQDYQRQEEQVNQRLTAGQAEYNAAMAAWRQAHARVDQLDAQLTAAADALRSLDSQVASAQQDLAVKQAAAQAALRLQQQR